MRKKPYNYERIGLATEKLDFLTDLPLNISGAITGDSIMKRIPLTQGKFTIVDDEDYEELVKHKWYAQKRGNLYYAERGVYEKKTRKRHLVRMSHQVLGVLPGIVIDHINGNPLDNRKSNLRICTLGENARNARKTRGTSKYKGVRWYKPLRKWRAQIWHNNKSIHLGYFTNEQEAAKIYNKKAKELFGEFARLNDV